MKIKFLKPFRLYNPIGDDMMIAEGAIENMEKEDYAEWLIDSGFAEEVKETGGWKPKHGERYYYLGSDGGVYNNQWENDSIDNARLKLGSVFKTEEATERHRDYLEAIATVRQDEGVLTLEQAAGNRYNYYIWIHDEFGLEVHGFNADYVSVNTVLFDTRKHAQASLDEHWNEWKIIANYDWSRE